MHQEDKQKDIWDKSKIAAHIVAAIVIPIVIGFTGNRVSLALKNRESETKMVELAVDILTKAQTNVERDIRKWAVDVITKYSGVDVSKKGRVYLETNPIFQDAITSINSFSNIYTPMLEKSIVNAANNVIDFDSLELMKGRRLSTADLAFSHIAEKNKALAVLLKQYKVLLDDTRLLGEYFDLLSIIFEASNRGKMDDLSYQTRASFTIKRMKERLPEFSQDSLTGSNKQAISGISDSALEKAILKDSNIVLPYIDLLIDRLISISDIANARMKLIYFDSESSIIRQYVDVQKDLPDSWQAKRRDLLNKVLDENLMDVVIREAYEVKFAYMEILNKRLSDNSIK